MAEVVEAVRADDAMDTGEPLPRAEAIPIVEATLAEPVPGSPPRAVEPPVAQAEVVLPFSKFL
eukprot:6011962-Alexandrium_andersonii.AAC.1